MRVWRMGFSETIIAAFLAALLVACTADDSPSGAVDEKGYLGSQSCAPCHADIARAWASSMHRLAMLPARADAGLRATPSDAGPLVSRGEGLSMIGESLAHPDDVALGFALGQKHVEQYLGSIRPGRLQALPRAFDVRRREWFDLFAGEERTPAHWGHWTNRGMNANAQCLVCHATGYEKGYVAATDTYESRWREMGVGCEACHGPGGEHVEARRDGRPDPWATADPERLLDACSVCHARRVERAEFTPGDVFLDAFEPELLDTDAYHPDGQVKEELYELVSFQQSKMFHEGVRCWSCHDPHTNGTRAEGNALCRTCHETGYDTESHTHHAAGSPGADCRGCHMPITVYMQRDPRHDHSFGRPDPVATMELGIPNACNRCHAERDAAWAAEHVRAWYPEDRTRAFRRAVARTIAGGRAGDATTVPGLIEIATTGRDAVHRASAARLLARFPTASGSTRALLGALDDAEPLVRAGAAWALGQRTHLDPEAHGALLRRATDPTRIVRQHVAFALRDVDRADLSPEMRDALARSTEEWRVGQRRLGDTPEAHYNLAIMAASEGVPEDAIAAYREALRLWPDSFQTRHNLGMLLAELGRLDEGAVEFEAVLARDPVPDSAFALGLLRAQQGRWPAAIAALEKCVTDDPGYPRARYNLALAYAKNGEPTKALDELERAAAEGGTHREAVLAIIDLARQVNDKQRLERWVLEAARLDPGVRENPELRHLLGP